MRWLLLAACMTSAAAQDVVSILNVGDSISRRGHLQVLQEHLQEAGLTNYEFVGPVSMPGTPKSTNRLAYGGNTLQDILHGRTINGETFVGLQEALSEQKPGILLLMGGINNIVRIQDKDLADTEDAWNELIDSIAENSPETLVFIGAVTPVHSGKSHADRQPLIDQFNDFLRTQVRQRSEHGQKLIFVDTTTDFTDSDFFPDGLHPNASGDQKIGQAWFRAIQNSPLAASLTP